MINSKELNIIFKRTNRKINQPSKISKIDIISAFLMIAVLIVLSFKNIDKPRHNDSFGTPVNSLIVK